MADQEEAGEKKKPRPWGRRLRIALLIAGPVILIAVGLWYYFSHKGFVSTDDAFVERNAVTISTQVAGRVVAVPVNTNETVTRGEVLLKLDPAPFKAALEAAQAKLASVAAQVGSLKAQYQAIAAQIAGAQAQVAFLQREVKRKGPLAKKNVITNAALDATLTQLRQAKHKVAALQGQQAEALAKLSGNPKQPVSENADYKAAKAALKQAKLNLSYTVVRAPATGQLGVVAVLPGDLMAPGKAALPLVESNEVWIKANFKETALTHMRPGDPVTVTIDSYPDYTWKGHVKNISPASGEVFSLLPPQNASGNWVKVVQRIPVRIAIERKRDAPHLRAGMSAEVTVNVRGNKGSNRQQ
ncbi:MAG: HlyD family secretion protein [Gammaproteobacteria bacterium]